MRKHVWPRRCSLNLKRPSFGCRDYISNEQQLAELEEAVEKPPIIDLNDDGGPHMQACTRPPLTSCTPHEFEEDLYAFLTSRKETELVKHLRNKRITW